MSERGDILVVENDDEIRALLTEALGEEGYTVRSTSNRSGMHLALDAHSPDLLICDVDLDRDSGPSVIDDVCAAYGATMPMMLMTTNMWTARSLARQGLTFCLLKPFDLDELFTSVSRQMHSPSPEC
jgi:DNA-binding NtrC family response regulator